MFRVALSSVLANKVRLALTALAVVLGVSFVTGSFILTDSIDRGFGTLLTDASQGVDVYVNPASAIDDTGDPGEAGGSGPTLPAGALDAVATTEGVEAASGSVVGFAQFIDPDGEPVGGSGPPTLAFSFSEDAVESAITIREGRAPVGPDEATIDAGTATETGYAIGDEVPILTAHGTDTYTLVGITGFGSEDNLLGATVATFDLPTAQALLDLSGQYTQIAVAATPGTDAEVLRDRIADTVASDTVEVVTADDEVAAQQADISSELSFLSTALLAFAGIAVFVAIFLIVNTFSIIVAQRQREFGLLRAIGASTSQIRSAVLVEAVVVGLVAGVLGFGAGVGLSELMRAGFAAIGFDFPDGGLVIQTRTVVVPFVLATVVTVIASIVPARRAARISPMEALRDSAPGGEAVSRSRTVAGVLAAASGAASLAVGLVAEPANALLLVGLGAAVTFVGVALLAPYAAGPVAAVLGWVPSRLGVAGRLGRNNASHNRARTSSTASALMIGVALVTFVSIFAASATSSANRLFTEQLAADFTLTPSGFEADVPPGVAPRLAERDEVGATTALRYETALVGEGNTDVTGLDPSVADDLVDLGITSGSLAALADGGVLVSSDVADDHGLVVGDPLEVTFSTGARTLPVVGVYDNQMFVGSVVVSLATLGDIVGPGFDAMVLADAAVGVDPDTARAAIEDVLASFPSVEVQNLAELTASLEEEIDQVLNVIIGLLALAILIALIGIVNTLALSVVERTRELGLLRAVGMSRRQVRAMVLSESVIVAVFGGVLGVGVGTVFGWALVTALSGEGLALVVPGARIAVYVAVAAIAGVMAAVLPARRAARLDVLAAVTAE